MLTSCVAVTPIETSDVDDIRCQLSTKKRSLQSISYRTGVACHNSGCLTALGISALYTVSTAVISGSIVLIGNTVHWLEKQGKCDDGLLNLSVEKHNKPLLQQNGEKIDLVN